MSYRVPKLPDAVVAEWVKANAFDLFQTHSDRINWWRVSGLGSLSVDFLWRFAERLHWHVVPTSQPVPEDLIEAIHRQHPIVLDWSTLGRVLPLSPEFLERHLHRFSWFELSLNPHLTESFIRSHQADVLWMWITFGACYRQHISNEFIAEFQDRLYLNHLPPERLFVLGPLIHADRRLTLSTCHRVVDAGRQIANTLMWHVVYLEDWLVVWAMAWMGVSQQ